VPVFPFDLLWKKPRFHERPAGRAGSFMVASPTRAYVEGVLVAVEVYGKFATSFRLDGGTESVTIDLATKALPFVSIVHVVQSIL